MGNSFAADGSGPNVKGVHNGDITNAVKDIYGVVNGDVYGPVTGNIRAKINGNIKGEVFGDIYGDVDGNIDGVVHGTIRGRVKGDINGTVLGDIYGLIEGDIRGTVRGDMRGIVNGSITGSVRSVRGTVRGRRRQSSSVSPHVAQTMVAVSAEAVPITQYTYAAASVIASDGNSSLVSNPNPHPSKESAMNGKDTMKEGAAIATVVAEPAEPTAPQWANLPSHNQQQLPSAPPSDLLPSKKNEES